MRAQTLPFLLNILRWLLVAIPATWTNSWLSYVQNKLAIAYRTRLTEEVLKQYLGHQQEGPEGKTYYKLCGYKSPQFIILADTIQANLDDRVKNPDQMITHDIQKFSNNLAAIYANLAKPVLDVILYNYQLSQNVGAEGLVLLTVLVQLTAALRKHSFIIMLMFECLISRITHAVRKLTPPFGAYTSMSAQLMGALRHTHSRLVEFAEEIAFFGGEDTEKMLVEREYAGLVMHEKRVLVGRWWHGCVEEGIVKWLWGGFGVGEVCAAHKLLAYVVGIARHLCNSCLLQASWYPQHRFGKSDRR